MLCAPSASVLSGNCADPPTSAIAPLMAVPLSKNVTFVD